MKIYVLGLLWALLPALFLAAFYIAGYIASKAATRTSDFDDGMLFFSPWILSWAICPLPLVGLFLWKRSLPSAVCLFISALVFALCYACFHFDPGHMISWATAD